MPHPCDPQHRFELQSSGLDAEPYSNPTPACGTLDFLALHRKGTGRIWNRQLKDLIRTRACLNADDTQAGEFESVADIDMRATMAVLENSPADPIAELLAAPLEAED